MGTVNHGFQNVRGSHMTYLCLKKKKSMLPWQPLHSTLSLPRHTKIGNISLRNKHLGSACLHPDSLNLYPGGGRN